MCPLCLTPFASCRSLPFTCIHSSQFPRYEPDEWFCLCLCLRPRAGFVVAKVHGKSQAEAAAVRQPGNLSARCTCLYSVLTGKSCGAHSSASIFLAPHSSPFLAMPVLRRLTRAEFQVEAGRLPSPQWVSSRCIGSASACGHFGHAGSCAALDLVKLDQLLVEPTDGRGPGNRPAPEKERRTHREVGHSGKAGGGAVGMTDDEPLVD